MTDRVTRQAANTTADVLEVQIEKIGTDGILIWATTIPESGYPFAFASTSPITTNASGEVAVFLGPVCVMRPHVCTPAVIGGAAHAGRIVLRLGGDGTIRSVSAPTDDMAGSSIALFDDGSALVEERRYMQGDSIWAVGRDGELRNPAVPANTGIGGLVVGDGEDAIWAGHTFDWSAGTKKNVAYWFGVLDSRGGFKEKHPVTTVGQAPGWTAAVRLQDGGYALAGVINSGSGIVWGAATLSHPWGAFPRGSTTVLVTADDRGNPRWLRVIDETLPVPSHIYPHTSPAVLAVDEDDEEMWVATSSGPCSTPRIRQFSKTGQLLLEDWLGTACDVPDAFLRVRSIVAAHGDTAFVSGEFHSRSPPLYFGGVPVHASSGNFIARVRAVPADP